MSAENPVLERLLRDARHYVVAYEPRLGDEESEQTRLLREIDEVLLAPAVPVVACASAYCCLPDGHEGACDDLPF